MKTAADRWLDSDPGHPLGPGYPGGSPLRQDGESHRTAWMRLLRGYPCAYCHRAGPAGTLDHVEPRCRPARAPGGAHCWTNYTGACPRCNAAKADKPLLVFLAVRCGVVAPCESDRARALPPICASPTTGTSSGGNTRAMSDPRLGHGKARGR